MQERREVNTADVKAKGIERSAQTEAMLSAAGLDVLSALRTGIICVLPDGTISAVNDAAAEALGLNESRHIGSDFWSAFPALHDGRAHDLIVATMTDGVPRAFHGALPGGRADATHEVRVARTRSGWLVFEVRENTQLSRDSSGEDSEPLREIARRMAAGSDSETLLSVLCDAARDLGGADGAIVARLAGSDGIVVAASGADAPDAGKMFGIAETLAGNALRSRALIVEHDDPSLACPIFEHESKVGEVAVAPLIAAEHPVGLLCAWHRDNGATFSARDRQRLRTIADHAAVVLVKARLLEEAQAATHAKGVFLQTISHELRTPLTALTGYGELLADEILGPLSDHQLDMVDRMRSVTHQLGVMVDELLTFSALEAGRETIHPADVSLAEVMDAAVTVIEPSARQKDLALAVTLPERPPMLYTDGEKVRQILVNLLGNAVKFTEVGSVNVAVARRNGEVEVNVFDTGIGIADDDLQRLFQPFTQLDSGLTRRHGGTGLGLYNSSCLARLLGGRIEVQSALGQGSRFSLIIPVRYSKLG
ncbi:MAG TPA: ATP-binding protein [Gemmatimonadaceae bacterium]|nr:ATP-binding protein [Gemmatimonadaceae bacterium]